MYMCIYVYIHICMYTHNMYVSIYDQYSMNVTSLQCDTSEEKVMDTHLCQVWSCSATFDSRRWL